jgi:hydroxymethylglutaryl-CoA lyase
MLRLCDVTLRDGLQSLKKFPSTIQKVNIINGLLNSGIKDIEIGSNVSKKVQAMSDIKFLLKSININEHKNKNIRVLVPNKEKMIEMLPFYKEGKIDTFSLITTASNTFSLKNTGINVIDSIQGIKNTIFSSEGFDIYKHSQPNFRVYISCCFGCPFEGNITKEHINNIEKILEQLQEIHYISEIVISDTNGSFNENVLKEIITMINRKDKLWLHLHTSPENIGKTVDKCLEMGIYNYDVSLANLGGCSSVKDKKIHPNLNTLKLIQEYNLRYSYDILENINKNLLEMI